MMRRFIFRMVIVLLLSSFIFLLSAQVTITGRVTANDAPEGLADARVNMEAGNNEYSVQTGDNGNFTINNVQGTAAGINYDFEVSSEGYVPYRSVQTVHLENINLGNIDINEIVWAPRNVAARQDEDEGVVNVSWDGAGTSGGTEQWIHYDSGQANLGIGANAAIQFEVAVRFTPEQLRDLDVTGLYITTVRFNPREPEATYTVKVYRGGRGEPLSSGQEITSQLVQNVRENQWNEVILDNPVEITLHDEIWFGYHIDTPGGHPANASLGPPIDGFSNLMFWGNQWTTLLQNNPDLDYNWSIQGYAGFARGERSVPLNPTHEPVKSASIHQTANAQSNVPAISVEYNDPLENAAATNKRQRRIADRTSRPTSFRELEGYTIFRFSVDDRDDPDEWIELATIEDTVYTDTTWEDRPQGLHQYAVKAVYTGDLFSRIVMSNVVYPQHFADGVGTRFAPWQIETAEHLDNVREFLGAEHSDKFFVQIDNIDLGVAPWNAGEGWNPIGVNANRFFGNYDGDHYKIENLTIDRAANQQGLFGYTESATLTNIVLIDYDINANTQIGPIAGYIRNSLISGCYTDGTISGSSTVGGIAGYSITNSIISNSYVTGNVTASNASSSVGGILGYQIINGRVHNCYSAATVTGNNSRIGGIMGANWTGNIDNCYASGQVVATGASPSQIGGLAGHVSSGVSHNSFWNIETTGQQISAGGGEGKSTAEMIVQETFTDWDFDNVWRIGHENQDTYPFLLWQEEPTQENYPLDIPPSNVYAGTPGDATVIVLWSPPSYGEPDRFKVYRNNTLLQTFNVNITQFQDNNVNNLTTYRYHVTAEYDEVESLPSNVSFVTPIPGGFADGIGTPENPYVVSTADHLEHVRRNPAAHYIQDEDIDIGHIANWTPIGDATNRFFGSYNGQRHTISNITIDRETTDNQGLFGYVGNGIGAVLKNIHIDNAQINARRYIGGLVGRTSDGTIVDSCYVFADIQSTTTLGSVFIGGLVGDNRDSTIRNSFSSGSVISTENKNYVGGFVGYNFNGLIENCFSTSNVQGGRFVGGFTSYHRGVIRNSYSRGNVVGEDQDIGGFVAYVVGGDIHDSFSTGRVTTPPEADNVGGFIGRYSSGDITSSYWDVLNSGRDFSAAGTGRQTNQMTYPYDNNTYVGWDFEDAWREDTTRRFNNGYPYHYWHPIIRSPHPGLASNPQPQNQANNAAVDLEQISWSYIEDEFFTNPVGFRVYFHTSEEFDEEDFVWVPYAEDEENYSTADVLPEELFFRNTYYWKVVPTTIDPNDDRRGEGHSPDRRSRQSRNGRMIAAPTRNDAEHVVVWRFTVQTNPKPAVAFNPQPVHRAEEVSVDLERLGWTYFVDEDYSNPVGFRVYLNTTGEFGDDDDYVWVAFLPHQSNYNSAAILPDQLDFDTTYYWKVVPTTERNERQLDSRRRYSTLSAQRTQHQRRGDAENVPIWSFTTVESSPNPQHATNPSPEHLATGVSTGLESVSWDYVSSEVYTDPVGFRVYLNTTGNFGPTAPYIWIDYDQNQQTYSSLEVVPEYLDENTTYFWRVIPTTMHPDDRTESKHRRQKDSTTQRLNPFFRGDAHNVPTWRFTTGATDVDENINLPETTRLHPNYPNPFNPQTTISFSLTEKSNVAIEILNTKGQRILILKDKVMEAGYHQIIWNGKDQNNEDVSSGIYFSVMKAGNEVFSRKMIMIK